MPSRATIEPVSEEQPPTSQLMARSLRRVEIAAARPPVLPNFQPTGRLTERIDGLNQQSPSKCCATGPVQLPCQKPLPLKLSDAANLSSRRCRVPWRWATAISCCSWLFFCYFFPFNEEKKEKAKGGHQTKSKQRTNELDLIPPLRPSRAAGAHTNSQFSLVVLLIMTSLTS